MMPVPSPGDRIDIRFEPFDVTIDLVDNTHMRLKVFRGPDDGFTDETRYELTPAGDGGLRFDFTETNGSRVSHAIDRQAGRTHTIIKAANGEVFALDGTVAVERRETAAGRLGTKG